MSKDFYVNVQSNFIYNSQIWGQTKLMSIKHLDVVNEYTNCGVIIQRNTTEQLKRNELKSTESYILNG